MGYTVDQGISARLLESRVGGEEYFSRLEYFLDMDCIVVLPKRSFGLSLLRWINGPKQKNVEDEAAVKVTHQILIVISDIRNTFARTFVVRSVHRS